MQESCVAKEWRLRWQCGCGDHGNVVMLVNVIVVENIMIWAMETKTGMVIAL